MDSPGMSPSSPTLNTNDVASDLDSSMENELGTELDGPLSPGIWFLLSSFYLPSLLTVIHNYYFITALQGTIDKSLELPIDAAELANQASRLLDEHDFTEVLNKIPDEAFRELFNGMFTFAFMLNEI